MHKPLRDDLFRETCVHTCLQNFQCIFDVFLHQLELSVDIYGTFLRELVPYDFLLVVLHIISSISLHLRCMLGGSV